MQDKRKSNKEQIGVEENINKTIENDKKATTKKSSSIRQKEKTIKSSGKLQKKIASDESMKSELNTVLSTIKEKEIVSKDAEVKVKSKSTEGVKKTSTRKTTSGKTSVKSKVEQEIDLKIQGNPIDKPIQNLVRNDEVKVKKEKEIQKSITEKPSNSNKDAEHKSKKTSNARKSSSSKAVASESKLNDTKEVKLEEKQIKDTVISVMKEVDVTEMTSFNTYLFHQGKNYESYNILGSHVKSEGGNKGVQFATWAPNAKEVYVTGDFCDFEIRDEYKLERITENGLWKGFFGDTKPGDKYKYYIIGKNNKKGEYKADPYAIQSELRPGNASIIYKVEDFKWNDEKWIEKRNEINVLEIPLNIYEIHLASWKTNKDGGFLTYEELAEKLPKYISEMGYTHVEIMPLVEHPLDASWGYQGTGYYSPTSRYGKLEGLKYLINKLHEANIGVIMDWVPGHFCKDAHGLYKFDGTPTYEYQEEWRAENKGWGTCNFDLGRPEVKSYLISNALYWYREFHIDGLRVDAVSSILYLDYSRAQGEWVPNKYGGNGNLEAIDFLKELNKAVFQEYPTALMIAEESTSWPNVTKPTIHDGLGFNLKWNMGWMNDTLEYVEIDPKYRKHNHRNITFAMMYNHAENYLLPLSHDEVVHGKKSLTEKMWGDEWNKFAGMRAFMGYMMGHPGKKLVFMGCEFGQRIEWREYEQLEWDLIDSLEIHKKTHLFFKDLNKLYLNNKAFWELDHNQRGFNWIEADNSEQSVLIFTRRSRNDTDTLIFVINFTPKVYYDYQIGVPFLGSYEEAFNTDDSKYGGSGQVMGEVLISEKLPFHNQPYSLKIKVPPMAALILKVNEINVEKKVEKVGIDEKEV